MKSCVIIRSMFNGSVTVAPSRSLTQKQRAEPLFGKLFRDDPDRGSCDILLEAAQAVGRPESASRPGQHGDPDRIGGPIWGKLWVRSASAS
jgi:hypothetical protein